jgi:hypothetical protein
MTRIQVANELLAMLDQSNVEARINQMGKLMLRPADRVSPEIHAQCREYLAELKALLEGREATLTPRASLPCARCSGSGREPSALEQFSQIESLLRSLMWADGRIALLRDEIRADEALLSVRWGGVDLKSPDGSQRTLPREH